MIPGNGMAGEEVFIVGKVDWSVVCVEVVLGVALVDGMEMGIGG